MKKVIRDKWVKALRSGKFKQGDGQLMQDHGPDDQRYCCLGVLCKITGNANNRDMCQGFPKDDGKTEDFCGLTAVLQSRLAEMNDEGKTFDEIANYIETHVEAN
jgi:hypothetical protein